MTDKNTYRTYVISQGLGLNDIYNEVYSPIGRMFLASHYDHIDTLDLFYGSENSEWKRIQKLSNLEDLGNILDINYTGFVDEFYQAHTKIDKFLSKMLTMALKGIKLDATTLKAVEHVQYTHLEKEMEDKPYGTYVKEYFTFLKGKLT